MKRLVLVAHVSRWDLPGEPLASNSRPITRVPVDGFRAHYGMGPFAIFHPGRLRSLRPVSARSAVMAVCSHYDAALSDEPPNR